MFPIKIQDMHFWQKYCRSDAIAPGVDLSHPCDINAQRQIWMSLETPFLPSFHSRDESWLSCTEQGCGETRHWAGQAKLFLGPSEQTFALGMLIS